jgi:hypothetical protein
MKTTKFVWKDWVGPIAAGLIVAFVVGNSAMKLWTPHSFIATALIVYFTAELTAKRFPKAVRA